MNSRERVLMGGKSDTMDDRRMFFFILHVSTPHYFQITRAFIDQMIICPYICRIFKDFLATISVGFELKNYNTS